MSIHNLAPSSRSVIIVKRLWTTFTRILISTKIFLSFAFAFEIYYTSNLMENYWRLKWFSNDDCAPYIMFFYSKQRDRLHRVFDEKLFLYCITVYVSIFFNSSLTNLSSFNFEIFIFVPSRRRYGFILSATLLLNQDHV